jgi:hypothetical protein
LDVLNPGNGFTPRLRVSIVRAAVKGATLGSPITVGFGEDVGMKAEIQGIVEEIKQALSLLRRHL